MNKLKYFPLILEIVLFSCAPIKKIEEKKENKKYSYTNLEKTIKEFKGPKDSIIYSDKERDIYLCINSEGKKSVFPIERLHKKETNDLENFPLSVAQKIVEFNNIHKENPEEIKILLSKSTIDRPAYFGLEKKYELMTEFYIFENPEGNITKKGREIINYFEKIKTLSKEIIPKSPEQINLLEKLVSFLDRKQNEIEENTRETEKIYVKETNNEKLIYVYNKFKPEKTREKYGNFGPLTNAINHSGETLKKYAIEKEAISINYVFGRKIIYCKPSSSGGYYESLVVYKGIGSKKKIDKELTKKIIKRIEEN